MQSSSWQAVLQLVPAERHDRLVLVTSNGTEINLQGILRAEADYLVIRGRIAASTEAGRVFFIPYDQLNYLGFRDSLTEADIVALFGASPPRPSAGAPPSPAPAETIPDRAETAVEAKLPSPAGQAAPAGRDVLPPATPLPASAKAALLERLRRTRAGQDTPRPPLK